MKKWKVRVRQVYFGAFDNIEDANKKAIEMRGICGLKERYSDEDRIAKVISKSPRKKLA